MIIYIYVRNSSISEKIPSQQKSIYIENSNEISQKLRDLKQTVRAKHNVTEYTPTVGGKKLSLSLPQKIPKNHPQLTFFLAIDTDGKLQLENLNEFGEKFLSNVWLQIDKKFPLQTSNSDPLVTEKEFHERFGETRLKCFVGRVDILNDLSDYINSSINSPLVLSGPNGIFSEFFSS